MNVPGFVTPLVIAAIAEMGAAAAIYAAWFPLARRGSLKHVPVWFDALRTANDPKPTFG